MNSKITPQELKNTLEALNSTPIEDKELSYNIIIVQTARGKMTVKTHLTPKEWIESQELKRKNLPSRKKKKRK